MTVWKGTNRDILDDVLVSNDIREDRDGRDSDPASEFLTASLNQSIHASNATGRIQLWKLSDEK